MYGMVLMAALTTGTDVPDFGGRRGGGCHGCYGGCYGGMAWGGCRGGGWGGCYGGGCYGGGWGGCYGGYARGGCYGGCGGMAWGGWGGGYGGMAWGGVSSGPVSYAYTPMIYGDGTPMIASNANMTNPATRSFFYNPAPANEATLIVHLPAEATLTIDGKPTRSTSGTRTFFSPPLEPGKTYTYALHAEVNRDGRNQDVEKTVEVRAGQPSEVTLNFAAANREDKPRNDSPPDDPGNAEQPRRTPLRDAKPTPRPLPVSPPDR